MIGSSPALAAAAFATLALLACNDVGTCPAASAVVSGGTCSGDNLECPYTLETPSPACDGTAEQLATSCVCTNGAWACPAPVDCGDAGGSEGGDDGGGGGDGASADAE